LEFLWSDRRLGLAVAAGLAAVFALFGAWFTPRGPITTTDALMSMGAALALGVVAGLAMRSRWSLLVTPVVFVAVVLGRGLHGLLVLAPMILGARFGVEVATRLWTGATGTMGRLGWIVTGLVSLRPSGPGERMVRPARRPVQGADRLRELGASALIRGAGGLRVGHDPDPQRDRPMTIG